MAQVEPEAQGQSSGSTPTPNYPVLARDHANSSNGHANGSNGHGNGNTDGNGSGTSVSLDDPRTRLLLEQLLTTLSHESVPAEEKMAHTIGLGHYLTALRRRWRPMLFVFLVTTALIAFKLKPEAATYAATATMLLPTANNSTAAATATDVANLISGKVVASGGSVDTQIAVVESPDLVAKAMSKLPHDLRAKGWQDPNALAADVKAAAPISTDLIDITARAGNPTAAKALANEMIDVYGEYLKNQNKNLTKANLIFLRQTVNNVKHNLDNAKRQLQNFKEQTKVYTVETRLTQITTQLQNLRDEANKADAEVAAGDNSSTVLGDATTSGLLQKATEAKLKYETVLRDYYPTAPEAIKAQQDWQAADQLVKNRIATMHQTAQARARAVHTELAQAQQEASTLPATEYKLTELMGQVEQYTKTYQTLSNNLINMELQSRSAIATAVPLTRATGAVAAVRTWQQAAITAMICALVLAALAAVLLEQTDNTLHSVDDLESLLPHASVMGTMPLLKKPSERRLMQVNGNGNASPMLLESCRILRSNLAFATLDSPARSVLITSADPGEGKSLSALNLATVMAFDGRKVVLIDCDLRRPAQHFLHEIPLEPGVSNVLSGESTIEQTIKKTPIDNLWVIPAGSLQPNPPELLGSGHCRQMLQDLKEHYDVVIIDSPPVLSLTDAQVLCSLADGVVMVVGADSTAKPHVKRAQAMLRHAGGRVLGIILNKVRESNNPDSYGAYYSYSAYGDGQNLSNRPKGLLTRGR
ncbi:MAG: polysaccharide biosynthesis tyrosine autokinase [Abitibacteriaceae bacterium]|nr:polysaccharide biosynthesis tyrosine autokinase [Abditibacteriaceae bacterium]